MAVVGVARWKLRIPASGSLKQKRSVVRSLRDRMRSRLSVSAAETGLQDRRQYAELCAAVVSSSRAVAERVLAQADRMVRSDPRAEVIESESEFF